MSLFLLTVFFSILALGGLGMIVHGLRLKPQGGRGGDEAEDVFADFSGRDAEPLLDLEMATQTMEQQEKKAFDPKKHQPEALETGKKE